MTPTIPEIVADMLAYEAEAWENDGAIDGGDLVEAFSVWRARLRAAEPVIPAFTLRETGTILAALRHYQATDTDYIHRDILDLATLEDAHDALDDTEINVLCERINCSEVALERPRPPLLTPEQLRRGLGTPFDEEIDEEILAVARGMHAPVGAI